MTASIIITRCVQFQFHSYPCCNFPQCRYFTLSLTIALISILMHVYGHTVMAAVNYLSYYNATYLLSIHLFRLKKRKKTSNLTITRPAEVQKMKFDWNVN